MGRAPDDLFDFMRDHSRAKKTFSRILRWIDRSKERFASFVVLSIALHVMVFGLLAVARPYSRDPQPAAAGREDAKAIRLAMESLRLDARENAILSEALAGLTKDDLEEVIERAPELDPRLGERERTAVFRTLMNESLERLGKKTGGMSALDAPSWDLLLSAEGLKAMTLPNGDRLYRFEGGPEEKPRLYRLPAKAAKRIDALRSAGDREKEWREVRGGQVELRTERGFLRVPEEYYFRECPYEQMMALGGSLFYAVSGFPRLDPPEAPERGTGEAEKSTAAPAPPADQSRPRGDFAFVFLPAPASEKEVAAEPAVASFPALSEENIEAILDGLMELVDEDQVRAFSERYLDGVDPDDPVLARLSREFLYRNLGSVFILGDELSSAFDFLEELTYNKLFQNKLVAYGLKNRTSRTGTEMLLCLAALYDFERRGLAHLADSLDEIEAVLADKPRRAEVFNERTKAFVLREVYRDLVAGIKDRGRDDLDSVLQEYREEQEKIYRLLVGLGGEAKSRALYALGGMYWDDGREDQALKTWQTIDSIYVHPTLAGIRWILSLTYGSELVWSRIDALFQQESGENSAETLDRLEKYHVWRKRSAKLRAAGRF